VFYEEELGGGGSEGRRGVKVPSDYLEGAKKGLFIQSTTRN